MRRREFLRFGAAAGIAGFGGCGGLPGRSTGSSPTERRPDGTATRPPDGTAGGAATVASPEPPPYSDRFDVAIDVTEAGADPGGTKPIGDILREHAGDDTMLYFPPGRYRLQEPWRLQEFTNFGLVGDGATIAPEDGAHETFITLGAVGQAERLLLSGLTFDFRAEETGGRPFEVRVDDGLEVVDLSVTGTQDVQHDMMRFDVTHEDGHGVVRRLELPDGGVPQHPITGCYVGGSSRGTLTLEDCRIVGFPDNGLYASSAAGPVNVIGGYYANNGISNVRVGGKGLVRGVHVRCDDGSSPFQNMRGIRLDHGGAAVVENCTIEMLAVSYSDAAISLSQQMAAATIRNSRIRVDTDRVPALWAKTPTPGLADDASLTCENLDIVGSAGDGPTLVVDDRDSSVFDGLRIHQTGANRDGILIKRSGDNVIRDTRIDVTGKPIRLENATAETINLVFSNGTPDDST